MKMPLHTFKTLPLFLAVWFVAAFQLAFCDSAHAQATDIPNWDLVWNDEFDGNELDTSKWNAIFSNSPTNNSLHAYRPSQVTVSNGNLVITSENIPTGGRAFRSGQVISTVAQTRGRFEVRGMLPYSKGMWPAIWLLPDVQQYPWPSGGEIDLMENRGNEPFAVSSAFHWGTNSPYEHFFTYFEHRTANAAGPINFHEGFHTYAVDWQSDQLRFYVDDVHYHTVFNPGTNGFLANQVAPMNMVLNTAIGGDFLDNPDGSTVWPQQFLIDYSRSFQRSADAYTLNFENGEFESNGGSLAHWTVFESPAPNITTSDAFSSQGSNSLKLFGPFNNNVSYSGVEQGMTVTGGESLTLSADTYVSSSDSISGTNNEVVLKIDYYSQPHGAYGSSAYITSHSVVLANSGTVNNTWINKSLNSTVPNNAVEARAAVVFVQRNFAGGSVYVDNVQLIRQSDLIPAMARKILTGADNGDQLLDSLQSDNIDYELQPANTSNLQKQRVDLILLSETTTTAPSNLEFLVEASMSGGPAGDVQQEVQLYNQLTDTWESIDEVDASNGDSIHVSEVTGNPSRFIHQTTGEVLARIIWSSTTFAEEPYQWSIDVDQAGWKVETASARNSREVSSDQKKDGEEMRSGFKKRTINPTKR